MKSVLFIAACATITALGLYVGWAMDHSHLPPLAGGWRCYLGCVALVWAVPIGCAGLLGLPAICRRIAEALSA
jgi:hypothetical protein